MKLRKFSDLNKDSGTTLVELLAAIAILSLIVTAFLAFFIQGARTNTRASVVNEATFIAQEQMEQMVHYSQTLTIDELKSEKGFSDQSGTLSRSIDTPGYSGEITVSEIEGTAALYTVKVTVIKDDRPQTILENRLPFRMRETE